MAVHEATDKKLTTSEKVKLQDLLERAGWTAGQQLVAVLLAASAATTVADLPWEVAIGTAIGAGIASALQTFVQLATGWFTNLGFVGDLLTRLVKTFIASFLAALAVNNDVINVFDTDVLDVKAAANLAAVTAILALAKGALAGGGSDDPTPSTLSRTKYAQATGKSL